MNLPTVNPSLADVLDRYAVPGALGHAEGGRIRCVACGHRCLIGEGKRGICKVRFNDAGRLKVPFGYVAGVQCDPVEKKPFFHVFPGSDTLTFGMMGCDLHCSYCQNWVTSQALRDPAAVAAVRPVTPGQLVEIALREQARLVVSSYNEPLITAEWAVAVFEQAKAAGLACAFVSNGNATPEVLDFLSPWICAYKVDLKSFDDRHYRTLGGTLHNITDTIRMIHQRGIWLEIVTLIIPDFNDADDELRAMARFIASVSRDIPWHVTAFHKDYRMTDPDATPPSTLLRAVKLGKDAGLRFVYAGNLPGHVGDAESTRCPGCGDVLIERYGYLVRSYRVTPGGGCLRCQALLPGIWPGVTDMVRVGNDMNAYARRLPRAVSIATSPGVAMTAENATVSSRLKLDAEEEKRLVHAARAMVRAIVLEQETSAAEAALGELGDRQVAGVFVSLKRGNHLRGCCGMLGEMMPLRAALTRSATRTVLEDARFPVVSPMEIDHLDMELWLLHSPTPVSAKGEDRIGAITVGRHGIQVVQGQHRGLFLPSVASEHGWDARQFLNQVCRKAGLHANAWRDDATALYTFEGDVVHARLADGEHAATRRPSACGPDELRAYAQWCHRNIYSMLTGATPNYYLPTAPDGEVTGAVLSLQGSGLPTHFSQMSLRGGVPLQATLFQLSQNAAQVLANQRASAEAVSTLDVKVAVLRDPALHGNAGEHDLAGFDSADRAILVVERNKNAIVFDPTRQPAEVAAEAIRQAHVTHSASATIFSLDVLATAPFTLANVPRPVRGPAVRQPGVAGRFYPAEPDRLAAVVDELLAGERRAETWSAAMLPHAGLQYSGRIAAEVLQRLQFPKSIIVIGPKHTALGMDWAVTPHQTWAIPGGSIESDFMLARQLCEAIPGLEMDALAHQREHAIEVELPLLARLAPESRVVGVAIGAGDLAGCRRFAEGLAKVMRAREEKPLLLISSDMNHFATDAENRRLDAIALEAFEKLDPAMLYDTVTQNQISMCGLLPAVIVQETLRLLGGLTRTERVGYATSADVTGDPTRVVGYAGVLIA